MDESNVGQTIAKIEGHGSYTYFQMKYLSQIDELRVKISGIEEFYSCPDCDNHVIGKFERRIRRLQKKLLLLDLRP